MDADPYEWDVEPYDPETDAPPDGHNYAGDPPNRRVWTMIKERRQ